MLPTPDGPRTQPARKGHRFWGETRNGYCRRIAFDVGTTVDEGRRSSALASRGAGPGLDGACPVLSGGGRHFRGLPAGLAGGGSRRSSGRVDVVRGADPDVRLDRALEPTARHRGVGGGGGGEVSRPGGAI